MLAPPKGNISYIRAEVERRRMIEGYEATMTDHARTARPIDAEISEVEGDWYLVHAFPGDDLRALRWLARRRFGVFRPMQQRTDKRNDAAVQGWEPVFPGYLFVYVWDIAKMQARIRACPGVMDILCYPDTFTPVPVNRPGPKQGQCFVDRLRELGWVYKENAPRQERHVIRNGITSVVAQKARRRALPKCQRKELKRLKKAMKSKGNWDASTWARANQLAPHERIALMKRTLFGSTPPFDVLHHPVA